MLTGVLLEGAGPLRSPQDNLTAEAQPTEEKVFSERTTLKLRGPTWKSTAGSRMCPELAPRTS